MIKKDRAILISTVFSSQHLVELIFCSYLTVAVESKL